MKKTILAVFSLFVLALSGCGGGQEAAPAPVSSAQPAPETKGEKKLIPYMHPRRAEVSEPTAEAEAKVEDAEQVAKIEPVIVLEPVVVQEAVAVQELTVAREESHVASSLPAKPVFQLSDARRIKGFKLLTKEELDSIKGSTLEVGVHALKCELKGYEDRHIVATDHFLETLAQKDEGYIWPIEFSIETSVAKGDWSLDGIVQWWKDQKIVKPVTREFLCKPIQ